MDKILAKAFGLDDFTIWLMEALDKAEDRVYDAKEMGADPLTIEILEAELNKLKEVRDAWCSLKESVKKQNMEESLPF